jgi:hypothetical protein
MSGKPPGLSIKAPEKTIQERLLFQEEMQKKLQNKHKKHAQTLKNIKEGKYGRTYVGENMKYHIANFINNNDNNLFNENIENIRVVTENNLFNNKSYRTPNPSSPSNKPPPRLIRTLKRKNNKKYNNTSKNNKYTFPPIKRLKFNQLGGKRQKLRTQRKTYRRYN